MELYKLSNEELKKLCLWQERVTDSLFPGIMSMVPLSVTSNIENANSDKNTGEIKPIIIPHIELLSFYISPITEMENEMKNRGILEEYRKTVCYIDYEKIRLLVYDSFIDRVSHLFSLHEHGFLQKEAVDKAIKIISTSQSEEKSCS